MTPLRDSIQRRMEFEAAWTGHHYGTEDDTMDDEVLANTPGSRDRHAKHGKRLGRFVVWIVPFVMVASPALANRADLAAFLERTEKMSEYTAAARADISLRRGDGDTDQAVLIVDPTTKRLLIALRASGWRALMPLDWQQGTVVKGAGAAAQPFTADEPLAGTDLRAMEFFAFWKGDYSTAFVSDNNRTEKVITLYASKNLPYVLFVIAFDKSTLVPLNVKYYKDAMSNLVRVRKDSDHVMVGSRPRPSKIEITDYTENRTTSLELQWRSLDHAPRELTDPASFATAEIDWPATP